MSTLKSRTRVAAAVATVAMSTASIFALATPASAAAVPPNEPVLPTAPAVALSFVNTNDIKADWDANPSGETATNFVVNFWSLPRVDDPYGVPVDLVQKIVAAPTTEYVWADATPGKTYNVTVAAFNAFGTSSDLVLGSIGPVPAEPPVPCVPPNCPPGPPGTNPERPFALGAWDDVIKRTYKEFASRAPKLDELTFWRFYITQGSPSNATLEARRLFFVSHLAEDAEQTDGPAYRLYTAYFGRNPDFGGLSFWSKKLRTGTRLLNVSDFFSTSSEFKNTYGDIDEAEFVALIYKNVLSRTPDGSGFSFWTRQLQSGRYSRAEVMIGFSESQEYKTRLEFRIGAALAYVHMLNRMPTEGELLLAEIFGESFPTSPAIGYFGNLYWRILDSVEYRSLGVTP
jgi:hypothetical protein